MTRPIARTPLHRSRFARILTDLVDVDGAQSREAFAEQLAQWIHIADAIALRAAHNANQPGKTNTLAAQSTDASAHVREAFVHARTALETTLRAGTDASAKAGLARMKMPHPKRGAPAELAGSFEPYKRYYIAHQREMELKIKPLRAKVRTTVGGMSSDLQQLAALDAALEGILEEREAMLLGKVPTLLEKRFKLLRKMHQDSMAERALEDNPDLWMQPGGWLTRFAEELQSVLLAELDLRLQPTEGLIESLDKEVPHFS